VTHLTSLIMKKSMLVWMMSMCTFQFCWRWKSVNLAMSLPSVLAWILYLIHWY
jgi:hypothetical protein